jgi:hypothetical protein
VFSEYSLNAAEINRHTMPVFWTLGIPNIEMILSRTGIVAIAEVNFIISTTGYLVNSSAITNIYSPDDKGPQMSALKFSHKSLGYQTFCMAQICT